MSSFLPLPVVGIDPGTHRSAYVILGKNKIQSFGLLPNKEFMESPALKTESIVGMEIFQSYGMAVGKEVFETAYWIGRFFQSLPPGTVFRPIYRTEVKNHTCRTARANDSMVRQAMIHRWGEPGKPRNPGPTHGITKDIWSALAIATTVYDWMRSGKPHIEHPAFAK